MSEHGDLHHVSTVIDCPEPTSLAPFWQELLGYEVAGWSEGWISLRPPGGGTEIAFQRVPEPKKGKNRLHLDLATVDVDGTVARAEGLGARKLWSSGDPKDVFITMADPAGNEFCICLDND
jgi:hypothetical protein